MLVSRRSRANYDDLVLCCCVMLYLFGGADFFHPPPLYHNAVAEASAATNAVLRLLLVYLAFVSMNQIMHERPSVKCVQLITVH